MVLSALALGDRRTNSAFKRASFSFDSGIEMVDDLCDLGMLRLEKSGQKYTSNSFSNDISEKLHFTTPFARFWFSFVSPIFKGIRDGNYIECFKEYDNKKAEYSSLVYKQLAFDVLKKSFKDDFLKDWASYWDNDNNNIDILAKTSSGKIIAGSVKYTNSKVKKSTLTEVKATCEKLGIKADIFVIFSKKGFSNELKTLKGESLRLYMPKNLSLLTSIK